MANELNYYGNLSQTGLTVVARVFDSAGAQVGSDVATTEAGTSAIYAGDMPTAPRGNYGVRFFDGATLLGQGCIYWSGSVEIDTIIPESEASALTRATTNQTEHDATQADIAALNNFDPATDTVARVTLVDTTTANTDMRGTDGANTTAPDNTSIAAILVDTNELQTNQGNFATATGFATPTNITDAQTAIVTEIDANETKIDTLTTNVSSLPTPLTASEVNAEVDQALLDYDGPTKAELDTAEANIIAGQSGSAPSAADIYAEFISGNNEDVFKADLSVLNDINTSQIRTELATELARIDVAVSSVAYNDTALTALVNALPTLTQMEASAALTAIADVSGLSTHDAAAVVTALQAVATDFQADVSAIETKAQADTRQAALIAEHDATQASLSGGVSLNPQDIRDAMKLAPSAGASAADSIDDKLDDLETQISGLSTTAPTEADIYNYFTDASREDAFKANLATLNDLSIADLIANVPSAQDNAIATEQAILNESDGRQILNAIVGAIGNTNVDEIALVAAIRADLERTGGAIKNIEADTNELQTNQGDWATAIGFATQSDLAAALSSIIAEVDANETKIDALPSNASIKTQVDQAFIDYDAVNRTDLSNAESNIIAASSSGGGTASDLTGIIIEDEILTGTIEIEEVLT